MKSNPTEPIESCVAFISSLEKEVAALNERANSNAASLAKLENDGDINDPKILDGIIHGQAFAALIPRRIAAKETALGEAQGALLKACHDFIGNLLGPRSRAVLEKIRRQTRSELQKHFSDAVALERAVEGSALVKQWSALQWNVRFEAEPDGGVIVYAGRLIESFRQVEEFEKANP